MGKLFFTDESLATFVQETKTYANTAANNVKDSLLNGAGAAYDTLQELGVLIDENHDAIDALETVAAGKVSTSTTINGKALSSNVTISASDVGAYTKNEVDNALSQKIAVQIITWGADD